MKTYECVAHSGSTGKQIIVFVRAIDPPSAKRDALILARQQFGSNGGPVTIVSAKEV